MTLQADAEENSVSAASTPSRLVPDIRPINNC
jgi:hypothetical protein